MTSDTQIHIGRVFCDASGRYGNNVAVIVDECTKLGADERTAVANRMGFSEIVFIDDIEKGRISIYHVSGEIDFAGHAAVGAASFFREKLSKNFVELKCRNSTPTITYYGDEVYVQSRLLETPPWKIEFIESWKRLESLDGPLDPSQGHTVIWAWVDQSMRKIRARTFASDWDIPEDEANGSGCMLLAGCLGGEIEVHHGKGSIIKARHDRPGFAAVGGKVIWEDAPVSLADI